MDARKRGSKYALLIGLPTSFVLCMLAMPLSQFYPFAYILKLASLRIFWNPMVWIILIATIVLSLWQSGKVIAESLQKRNVIKTSFYFTFLVNVKLLIVSATIYFIGIIADWIFNVREIFLAAIPYSIISMVAFFALCTAVFSLSISLFIVNLTKGKVEEENAFCSEENKKHLLKGIEQIKEGKTTKIDIDKL